MKSIVKKSLLSLGILASSLGTFGSVADAAINWESSAKFTGVGSRVDVTAKTSQTNEPYYYKITVSAKTNGDSTAKSNVKNPASSTDIVSVSYRTAGPASTGYSNHEWVMKGDSASARKTMTFN